MRIVELKSQSVKIIYKPAVEQLKIGDFISFIEGDLTLIAQVYKILTSDAADDFNQADLSFILAEKYGKIKPWRGEFISADAAILKTKQEIIEAYINKENPQDILHLGKSCQYNKIWHFDFRNFVTPAFIGYEKREDNFDFINLLIDNLKDINKKLIIVDFKGNVENESVKKIIVGENAKLPLNSFVLECLSSDDLQGVSLESKAIIEDILMELSEYAKTNELGFIPISQLISVIDDFYKKSKITPLILLKNKLIHYKKQNIFADKKEEVHALYDALEKFGNIILDLSNIPDKWQKTFFNNLIEADERNHKDFYIHISLDEENLLDNKTINYLLFKASNNGIKPLISINYRNFAFDNVFDFCNNAFLFKTYNALKKRQILTDILQSLPTDTFITLGKLSGGLIIPSIVEKTEAFAVCTENNSDTDILDNTESDDTNDIDNKDIDNLNNTFKFENPIFFKNNADYINTTVDTDVNVKNVISDEKEVLTEINITQDNIQENNPAVEEETVTDITNDIKIENENTLSVDEAVVDNDLEENILQIEESIPSSNEETVTDITNDINTENENILSVDEAVVENDLEENIPSLAEATVPDITSDIKIENENTLSVDEIIVNDNIQENIVNAEDNVQFDTEITSDDKLEENILQLENIDIPDVDDVVNATEINVSTDDEILDLVEDAEMNFNNDNSQFIEETQPENFDDEDLDFLHETPNDIMQTQDNDDDLFDLIDDNNEQVVFDENAFENIEFEEIEPEKQEEVFEEVSFDDNTEAQNNITQQMQTENKIPVYEANSYQNQNNKKEINLHEGDLVKHSKYGVGTIKKITFHADKILCHINFDTCGRRLIDPEISVIQKID